MAGFASEHSQRGGTLAWMAPGMYNDPYNAMLKPGKELGPYTRLSLNASSELLRGDSCSFASDVYSFGIVMFEIFSREDPYEDLNYDTAMLVQNILGRKLRPTAPANMPSELAVLMSVSGLSH